MMLPKALKIHRKTKKLTLCGLCDFPREGGVKLCGNMVIEDNKMKPSRAFEVRSERGALQLLSGEKLYSLCTDGVFSGDEKLCEITEPGFMCMAGSKVCIFPDRSYIDTEKHENGTLFANWESIPDSVSFSGNTLTAEYAVPLGQRSTPYLAPSSYGIDNRPVVRTFESLDFVDGEWVLGEEENTRVDRYEFMGKLVVPYINSAGDYSIDYWFLRSGTPQWKPLNPDGVYGIITDYETENDNIRVICTLFSFNQMNGSFKKSFSPGDNVSIICDGVNARERVKITEVDDLVLTFDTTFEQEEYQGTVAVKRDFPEFSVACEHNGRLWGMRGRTLYATDRGEQKNIVYQTEIWSQGKPIAMQSFGGALCIFKEDSMIRVLHDAPDCEMVFLPACGIAENSEKTLAGVGKSLYFAGQNGIFEYSGSSPAKVAPKKWGQAYCGAGYRDNYYLGTDSGIFLFDTKSRVLTKVGSQKINSFAVFEGELYGTTDETLLAESNEPSLSFFAELYPIKGANAVNFGFFLPSHSQLKMTCTEGTTKVKNGLRTQLLRSKTSSSRVCGEVGGNRKIGLYGGEAGIRIDYSSSVPQNGEYDAYCDITAEYYS